MSFTNVRLREATAADCEFIYRLVETTMRGYVESVWGSFSEDYTRKNTEEYVSARTYSVIELDGDEIGALAVERHDTHIQLTQLYVLPTHQNRGIGTYLIRQLIAEAKDAQKPLRLRVLSANPARRLYERLGFQVTSQTPERFFMELPPTDTVVVSRNEGGWSNASADRIELVDPDPSWPEQYEKEAEALRAVLGPFDDFRLEHFGSTAVPNVRAKPIIDILLIHPEREIWPLFVTPICSLGYVYWAENPRKDEMFFVKGMPPFGARRSHHVHVRTPQDAKRELAFRDALCADPALAHEYEKLKQALAERHATDRDAYTEGKSAFVMEALKGKDQHLA